MTAKKLYRSNKEKMLGGVCGGLAEYLNLDVTVVRLIFVALALLGGPGLLAYIILWVITPMEA
jgi:phage shock protein C